MSQELFNTTEFTQKPAKEPDFFPGFWKGKKRPTSNTDEIVAVVASRILPKILEWQDEEPEEDHEDEMARQEEILEELRNNIDDWHDGYQIARKLEDDGWDPDSELVDILDNLPFYQVKAEAVRNWIAENNIKPKLTVGTQVKTLASSGSKRLVEGEIVDVRLDAGQYTVMVPSLGHVRSGLGTHGNCINWEDLEELNP